MVAKKRRGSEAETENDVKVVSSIKSSEEEVNFPRGGASTLTPLEFRQVANQAATDLFKAGNTNGTTAGTPAKKKLRVDKKKTKAKSKEQSTKPEETLKQIDELSFKKLTVGTSLLGCIAKVNKEDLLISLPHQLQGSVDRTEISNQYNALLDSILEREEDDEDADMTDNIPELNDLYYAGQWVRCKVASLHDSEENGKSKKRVKLTLKPEIVNSDIAPVDAVLGMSLCASVQSVEDHGYILSLGIDGLTGFCPRKEAKSYIDTHNRGKALVVGQCIECVVLKASDNKRTVTVTLDRQKISKTRLNSSYSKIKSALPGHRVEGTVTAVQANGLIVDFMGFYSTTIGLAHIPPCDVKKTYSVGQSINFRILFCIFELDQTIVGGSLLPHVLQLDNPMSLHDKKSNSGSNGIFAPGTFVDLVTVYRVSRAGVYVSIDGVDNITGFIHISHLTDGHIDSNAAKNGDFKVGTAHRARVLGYRSVDAILLLTTQPSVLEQKYMTAADVETGSIVEGTVRKVIPRGVIIDITSTISALVPSNTMADATLTRPELRFKPGRKVRGRVLQVDGERQKIIMTLKNSLVNSELPIVKDLSEVEPGMAVEGTITQFKENQKGCVGCIVGFYNNITAFCAASEMTTILGADLTKKFRIGQSIKAWIVSVNKEANDLKVTFIDKAKQLAMDTKNDKAKSEFTQGKWVNATIDSVKQTQISLTLTGGMKGRIHVSEVFESRNAISSVKRPLVAYNKSIGSEINVRILGIRDIKTHTYLPITHIKNTKQLVECSLIDESRHVSREIRNIKTGEEYLAYVNQIDEKGIRVNIGAYTWGYIRKQHASADPKVANALRSHFSKGQAIQVVVIGMDAAKGSLDLMVHDGVEMPCVSNPGALKEGDTLNGVVAKIDSKRGLFIRSTDRIAGYVHITDLWDSYVDDPLPLVNTSESEVGSHKPCWKVGEVIRCMVVGVSDDGTNKKVDLSLRESRLHPSDTAPKDREIHTVEEIEEGQTIRGYVVNIADTGVFVAYGRNINARVQIANLSDSFVKEWRGIYHLGQLVKSKVLSVDKTSKKIDATLKPSAVDGIPVPKRKRKSKPAEEDSAMLEVSDDEEAQGAMAVDSVEEVSNDEDADMDEHDDDSEEDDISEEEDEEEEDDGGGETAKQTPALPLQGKFDWTGQSTHADSDASESDTDSEPDEKVNTKSKDKKKEKEVEDMTAELGTSAPQSTADYERLLIASPNSSYLWVNYMAFQLQLSEIDKARAIGKRALEKIGFREIQEKQNVWVAMLNLENSFGTEELLEQVFKAALKTCNEKKLYLQLAKIYERSGKIEKAKSHWETMTKVYSGSCKVWVLYAQFCLQNNDFDLARELLQRSMKSLPQRKHIKTIQKFAMLEFKMGEAERGRTIFEGLMSNHPKRNDLWSVYLDMEIRAGDKELIRRLFERVTSMKFSSKKMKVFFKKWLQYEKTHGTDDGVEHVKKRTMAYVEASTA